MRTLDNGNVEARSMVVVALAGCGWVAVVVKAEAAAAA